MKSPKVVERKLGKHKAAGYAWNDPKDAKFNTIEIDPRKEVHGGTKGYMDTFIHECIHMIDPQMHEDDVAKFATDLCRMLWKHGFRKVDVK